MSNARCLAGGSEGDFFQMLKAEFQLANSLSAVPVLLDQLDEALLAMDVPDADAFQIKLALEELATNAINYGFDEGQTSELEITLQRQDEELYCELRDHGRVFNPLEVVEPDVTLDVDHRKVGGLGVFLVRRVMDDVSYERAGNMNVMRLRKTLGREGK